MTHWVETCIAAATTKNDRKDRQKLLIVADRLQGKTLSSLNNTDAAKFVRVFDETYFPRSYRVVTPEGGFGEFVTKGIFDEEAQPGEQDGSVAWGNFGTIEKAVAIWRDDNPQTMMRTISNALGAEHKVRNFYNNIVSPNSADGHVTIDTHAIAAGLFKALSGASLEVLHNFGSTPKGVPGAGGNAASGAAGIYGLIADAYRESAAKLGMKARELQSITWEAIRSIFLPSFKSNRAGEVEAIFDRYQAGEMTREEARQQAYELGGGLKNLPWENTPEGRFIQDGGSSFDMTIDADQAKRKARNMGREQMQVSISASTESIPAIKRLYREAQAGNELAHATLQHEAFVGLKKSLKGTSAKVIFEPATGLYGGYSEPSIAVTVSFEPQDKVRVLDSLRQFADNYNQEQIHVRQDTKSPAGTKFADGSYATPVYTWHLKSAMSRSEIQAVIDKSGLYGLTFGEDFVEAYYVGDAANEDAINQFRSGAILAGQSLGASVQRDEIGVARLWPHGRGEGGIGWGTHDSDNSTGSQAIRLSGRTDTEFSSRDARSSGRSNPGDGTAIREAIHYGKQAGLSYLSGSSSGTGIKGAEQERLSGKDVDQRIKQRVYFYLPVAGGIPQPEIGLGGNVYQADIDGLYDPRTSAMRLPSEPNAFESAILDAGYKGYINPEQGTIVILNSDVPVKHIGSIGDHKIIQRRIERIIPKVTTRRIK
jgi:hypothetical protein